MARKGYSAHTKRISLGRNLRVQGRKNVVWITTSKPGPHSRDASMPLSMLLREEIPICSDLVEVKRTLNSKEVLIDGRPVKDLKRTIGIMDIVSIPKTKKVYRMQVIGGQLRAKEISDADAKVKFCKVIGKRTGTGSKILVTLHDGRNLIADNAVKVGSTLKMSVPEFKLQEQLMMVEGSTCYVIKGKHTGKFAKLMKVTLRAGSMPARATLESSDGEFSTLANYLIVVDDGFDK